MKIRQLGLLGILLMVVVTINVAQQTVTIPVTEYKVVENYFPPTTFSYGNSDTYSIGNQYWSSGPEENRVWRSMFRFDLSSIQTNAVITSASLKSWATDYIAITDGTWKYFYQAYLLPFTVDPTQLTARQKWEQAPSTVKTLEFQFGTGDKTTDVTAVVASRLSQSYVAWGGTVNSEVEGYRKSTSKAKLHLELTITYYIPFSVTTRNNFPNGTMGIVAPGITDPSANVPYTKTDTKIGDTFTFTAKPQQDNNGIDRVWANSVPIQPSQWSKNNAPIVGATSMGFSFTAAISDNNATYEAGLRRNYSVSRNDQIEFGGPISAGVVTQIVEQNSGSVDAPVTKIVNGITYYFYGWADGVTANPRTVTPTDNITVTAKYKGSKVSNLSSAFSNNSSRKVVKTSDGYYHLTYESMGSVWYEKLTENGTSITLKRIASNAKNPAIAKEYTNGYVIIVYQENNNGTNRIKMIELEPVNSSISSNTIVFEGWWSSYDNNLNLAVSINAGGGFLVVWEDTDYWGDGLRGGIFYRYGHTDYYTNFQFAWFTDEAIIPTTNSLSKTPTVECILGNYMVPFHVAWEQGIDANYSSINYCKIRQTSPTDTSVTVSTPISISDDAGYPLNSKPSLITLGDGEGARVLWLANYEGESTSLFHDPTYYAYWYFGNFPNNVSINKANDGYIIGWSQGTTHYYADNSLQQLGTISSSGEDLQVVNSDTKATMKVVGFSRATTPYSFNFSNNLGALAKSSATAVNRSRGGVIAVNKARIGFSIGDITINGEGISFPAIPETLKISSVEDFNSYLRSEPFAVNDNTNFTYGTKYWTPDSEKIAQLSEKIKVKFKVELVEEGTNKVLGVLEKCQFKNSEFTKKKKAGYKVDTKGIKAKTARLRIVADVNDNATFVVTSGVASSSTLGLGKNGNEYQTVGFDGIDVVTEYALTQNFPNPFNPTTTINYQIPKDGNVTIKVFDALGREVSTLVNEFKSSGRYSVEFDATRLSSGMSSNGGYASGVYFYSIKSEKYKAVKKMSLIK